MPRSSPWIRRHVRPLALLTAGALVLAAVTIVLIVHAQQPVAHPNLRLRVSGNELVDEAGVPVRLRGVDRSGTEFACVKDRGIFDGPSDSSSVAAMRTWNINVVRIPLNAHCWLGTKDVPAPYRGAPYRQAIVDYVTTLNNAGIVAVLDLHRTSPPGKPTDRTQAMPDADTSIPFWKSVGKTFAATPGVLFDLYNEPHDVSWSCWRDGCAMPGGWRAAGMQQLVDVVRQAGARQPILVGGLGWANDLSGWLTFRPKDPAGQLVASFHAYPFMGCKNSSCWDREVLPVSRVVPVVTGEFGGGKGCTLSPFVDRYLTWAEAHAVSWLAWTWDTWKCTEGHALIRSYDGTPTAYGSLIRAALTAHPQHISG
jgi:hypothetical protein